LSKLTASDSSLYGVVDRARLASDWRLPRTEHASSCVTRSRSVQRLSWGSRPGRSGSTGSPSAMSRSSASESPTSGRRRTAPSASVSRESASALVKAIRSWVSWRRKKPLPAWVDTAMPRSSSASSKRHRSVPTGASSAISPNWHGRIASVAESRICRLPTRRLQGSATRFASASRSIAAFGSSASTPTSSAATARPPCPTLRVDDNAVKPGCPAASDRAAANFAFTRSRMGSTERKLAVIFTSASLPIASRART
jgi:hypothetical protein